MEADGGPPSSEAPDDLSQRGSIASSAALTRAQDVVIYLVGDFAPVPLTVEGLGSVSVQELARDIRQALRIPDTAQDAFALWLCSPLLELQLKPRHQPYKLCRQWKDLLYRFSEASDEDISQDEPCLQYRRNVFYPKSKELLVEDEGVLRLLYEEARGNILSDRYPCDPDHWTGLGALALALDEGAGLDTQTLAAVLKEKKLVSFLPASVAYGCGGLLSTLRGRGGRQAALEHKLLDEYHKTCSSGPSDTLHLLHQYLTTCHALPYYGSAFFSGEIDRPVQGLLQRGRRKAVSVGISLDGVYVMDLKEKHVLLGLRFSELSWDHSYPEEEGDSHVLWLEFDGEEDGTAVNKLLKIYSKQAELMSGLIEFCVELSSPSGGVASAAAQDGVGGEEEATPRPEEEEPGRGRGGRRGRLSRQDSVVCSRVQNLSTISYVDTGKEIKRLKPRRAASFFARQNTGPAYATVQVGDGLEQG